MQVRQHSLLGELQSSLADVVPSEPVSLAGEWRSSRHRAYQTDAQIGSGSGPFIEVVDTRWTGTLACSVPIACVAFLLTPSSLWWAKSGPASVQLPVDLSISAHAEYKSHLATFRATVGGAFLPSLPVHLNGDAARNVIVETATHMTGHVVSLARLEQGEVLVYMIPGRLLKTGRKRLWHLRSQHAVALPAGIRELLTHRRNGRIESPS